MYFTGFFIYFSFIWSSHFFSQLNWKTSMIGIGKEIDMKFFMNQFFYMEQFKSNEFDAHAVCLFIVLTLSSFEF